MKIIHICITAPWDEQYAYQENLLPHYHRLMGHDVTILAPVYSLIGYSRDGIKPVGESLLSDGSRLIRLSPLFKNNIIDAHLHLVKGLKKAILKENPDVLFVHDLCSFNFFCLKRIKEKKPSIRIVADNHSDLVNSLHSPITKFLHSVVYRYTLIPSLLQSVEWFYGVTPSRCSFLHDIYNIPNNRIKLLVMGADDENMMLSKKEDFRKSLRKQYGILDNDFLIVSGGKIDRLKNIHILAHAVNSLNRKNVKLLVFGKISEEMRPLFEAESSPQLIIIGWVKSDKVYELFYASDLVVFPGLHSVLWEQAVASKVPCAFSKIEGFDHVQVNGNCILMEDNSSDYYKSLLERLINNPNQYRKLKANSESDKLNKFYYSNIAQQVFDDLHLE